MKNTMKIYDSFEDYVEQFVIPHQNHNPDRIRLDDWETGGNREIYGVFRYRNKYWKVHGDSRFEPLLVAYKAVKDEHADPFTEKTTNSGKGNSLILKEEFQSRLSKPRFKHLYIYEYM